MFSQKWDANELYQRFWVLKDSADKFLVSRKGAYLRFGILGAVIAAYPITNVLLSGPLLNTVFSWQYKISNELPEHLNKAIEQQSFFWLEQEGRAESDTFFTFSRQLDARHSLDSIRMGTLSSPTGAQISLPFYVKFKTEEDAMKYAKEHLEPFNVLGKTACIVWESELGRQLLSTFILSDKALAFLVARDLYGVQRPYLLTQEALSWFCHVLTFMLCFYALHMLSFNGDAIVFAVALPVLLVMAVFTAFEWNKFAIYANEHHADTATAKLSTLHAQGGREYYEKFLTRNRILRELVTGGDKVFTTVGDVKKTIAKYVIRFDGVNDVSSENEELTLSIAGDDLPS